MEDSEESVMGCPLPALLFGMGVFVQVGELPLTTVRRGPSCLGNGTPETFVQGPINADVRLDGRTIMRRKPFRLPDWRARRAYILSWMGRRSVRGSAVGTLDFPLV